MSVDITETLYGRRVIYTDYSEITEKNLLSVLEKALSTHGKNRGEIQYLYDYYKGKQPIRNRTKEIRPEINNKIVVNKIQYLSAESLSAVGLELPEGEYQFDEEGRLVFPDPRNGLINGIYYVDDVVVPNAGLIFQDGAYYYIIDDGRPVVGKSYYVSILNDLVWLDGTPVTMGTYAFDAEGKLIRG